MDEAHYVIHQVEETKKTQHVTHHVQQDKKCIPGLICSKTWKWGAL